MNGREISETEIESVLLNIGVPTNLSGFLYLTIAEKLVVENPEYIKRIVKGIYFDIAAQCGTTPVSVERCIRHAIAVAWLHGNYEYINFLFGNSVDPLKDKPTNSQFISRLYYYFLRNNKA
ncbi:MAG: sporulation initiation factor Spo0A C-terminal domain-containing protein [Lachnospiraceae bacterium]|nr:sporulation initiation factor Spo0A C-terminal domain-containing protein [Lachnospiraceae bacterium]